MCSLTMSSPRPRLISHCSRSASCETCLRIVFCYSWLLSSHQCLRKLFVTRARRMRTHRALFIPIFQTNWFPLCKQHIAIALMKYHPSCSLPEVRSLQERVVSDLHSQRCLLKVLSARSRAPKCRSLMPRPKNACVVGR